MTNNDGNRFTYDTPIVDVKPRHHYRINYDISSTGNGDFDISVDETLQQFNITKSSIGT